MAPGHKPKVYRLQGIPSGVQDAEEVSRYMTERCLELSGYEIQICSLAKDLTSAAPSSWVATVMFHPRSPSNDSTDCALGGDPVEIISKAKSGLVIDDHFLGMTPFNDVGLDDHEYDCIAVSGIGSHPFGSWQPHDGDKQFMWIRDILPKFFPSVRVMIYGYDTELCDTNSFQQIKDLAITFIDHLRAVFRSSASQRSVVLVAHSLGGIVVKQALVMLTESSYYEDRPLLKAISGAIFFGVPNHGMVISHLLVLASGQPNYIMIDQLKENAPFLKELERKFTLLSDQGEPFSQKKFFWGYETQESAIPIRDPADGKWATKLPNAPRMKLVERESATRGLWKNPRKSHFIFQINKDHSSIVKFANAHDSNLTVVVRKFIEIFDCRLQDRYDVLTARDACLGLGGQSTALLSTETFATPSLSATSSGPPGHRAKSFKLPSESPHLPELFPLYGRHSELAALSRILDGRATSDRLTVSVYGAPGIGKTQLVAHYIKTNREAYDNVFYVDGSSPERTRMTVMREVSRLERSWSQFFTNLRSAGTDPANIDRFCIFLNSEENNKWLLVVDEMQDSPWIIPFLDQLKQGTVILLSTTSQFKERFPAVRVASLNLKASDRLLLRLGFNLIARTNHRELLLRLDCHPVLIHLAAPRFMGFKTLSAFLNYWRDGDVKLPITMLDRLNSILNPPLRASQMGILTLCLLFDYKNISYDFLEYIGILNLQAFFGNTIEYLTRHGLVERKLSDRQSVTCSFSEILYQFLRQSATSWPCVVDKAARLLAQKVPRSYKDNYMQRIELLAPHAVMFTSHLYAAQKPVLQSDEFLFNIERIASLLRLLNKEIDALRLYNLIHQVHSKPSTSEAQPSLFLKMADVYNNMGLCCMSDGDMTLASSCFDKAESAPSRGETNVQIIANKARAYIEIGEYRAAIRLLRMNLLKNRDMDQAMLIPLKHARAVASVRLGHYDAGISLLEECRSLSESEQHRVGKLATFTIMHDLATAWRDQKKWNDAILLYEKTRECRENFHGPSHRYTIETTGALAVAYQGSGLLDKAAACFKKALRWQSARLRLNHPNTLQTLQNYGIFLSMTGDLKGAKKALQLAHGGWGSQDEKDKKTSWNRINSGVSLALVLRDPTDSQTAVSLCKMALLWYRNREGLVKESPRMAYQYSKTAYLSGKMLEAAGHLESARSNYREAGEVVIAGDEANYWKHLAVRALHSLDSTERIEPTEQRGTKRR